MARYDWCYRPLLSIRIRFGKGLHFMRSCSILEVSWWVMMMKALLPSFQRTKLMFVPHAADAAAAH